MNTKPPLAILVGVLLVMTIVGTGLFSSTASAKTFQVYSTDDHEDENPGDGECKSTNRWEHCTLRAAIEEANALPGRDIIEFNLCAGHCDGYVEDDIYTDEVEMEYWHINPESRLPYITDPVTINGWSQLYTTEQQEDFFGYRQHVMLFGGDHNVDLGLVVEEGGDGSIIEGLSIVGFSETSIDVANASGVIIRKNRLGEAPKHEGGDVRDWTESRANIGINLAGENNIAIDNEIYFLRKSAIHVVGVFNQVAENYIKAADVGISANGATHSIKKNRVSGADESGIRLHGRYHIVEGNNILHSKYGVWVSARDILFTDNSVQLNDTGLWLNFGNLSLNKDNCYTRNNYLDINNATGVDMSAASNWWGTSAGPMTQVGTPARVSANVQVVPWLTSKVGQCL